LEEAERVATEMGLTWHDVAFGPEQLRMGMDVELEHGKLHAEVNVTNDDPVKTGQIAWAHLMEFPDYYERLAAMEREGKAALAEGSDAPERGVVDLGEEMPQQPRFVSINGHVYQLADEAPEVITHKGKRYRRTTPAALREGKAWDKLPKGWTEDSVKKFWNSMTGGKGTKHPVSKCIRELEKKGTDIDDPGAFCASLADKMEPGWRSKKKKKKKKKKARVDYELPSNHPQLPLDYNVPIRLDKRAAAYLQGLAAGQGDPIYALSSRLFAYGATVATVRELEAAVAAVVDDEDAPDWLLDDLEQALVDAKAQGH
jgi:hypothetical protein